MSQTKKRRVYKCEGSVYKCEHCSLTFTVKSNLNRHQAQCYQNPMRAAGSRDFPCYDCGAVFSRADNLRSHKVQRKCSKEFESSAPDLIEESLEMMSSVQHKSPPHVSIAETIKKSRPCFIDGCTSKLLPRASLSSHLKSCHPDLKINDPVYFEFPSMTEFMQWKREEEERMSCSFYSKKGQGTSVQIYHCQFSSDIGEAHPANKSSQKSFQPSIQSTKACIAKVKVSILLDKILVQYHPTHIHIKNSVNITKPQSFSDEDILVPSTHEQDVGSREDLSAPSQPILERHAKGMLLPDDCAEEILENTWCFQSETCQSTKYLVVRCEKDCKSDHCYSKCQSEACQGLCAHMYSCSCNDSHPLCKHLHKLHSLLVKYQIYPEDELERNQSGMSADDYGAENIMSETSLLNVVNNFDCTRLEHNTELLINFLNLAKAGQVSDDILYDVDTSLNVIALKLKDLFEIKDQY
ncbi:uncharacterized protein LOC113206152 [Frankliniella occidentalis]|uniref:Uncharacterized protein LOC113206152 n=1 Tax=Frankliniella occidentalis TaxID=133901 RepID=A0A6J1SB61_FRAOC|nr:uncharacterized protein LOC113206152 [Frankliniella occidentalis]